MNTWEVKYRRDSIILTRRSRAWSHELYTYVNVPTREDAARIVRDRTVGQVKIVSIRELV